MTPRRRGRRRRSRRGLAPAPGAAAALAAGIVALVALVALVAAPPSWADAPARYGWWTQAGAGLAVAPPPPADVPSGGLYVENGFSGPTAMSALSFAVPAGAAIGPMVLKIAGAPVISQPPVACTLTGDFRPAQGGAWSARPSYDCSAARQPGTVDGGRTSVSFDVGPFLRNGTVAVVILAGGPADRIAFDPPGPDTLTVTSSGAPLAAPAGTSGADMSAAPGAGPAGASGGDSGTVSLPAVSAGLPAESAPLAPGAVPAPASGSPGAATGSAPASAAGRQGGGYALGAAAASAGPGSGWRSHAGEALGVLAVLFALVAWTEGFGVLGGRIAPLAAPRAARHTARARRNST